MRCARDLARCAAVAVLALLTTVVGTGPAVAVPAVQGGTFASPVALPVGTPGSFTADNTAAAPGSRPGDFSLHTTWFEFTATASGPISIAARATTAWDPELQLNEAGGVFVTGSDDAIGHDPVIAPVLTAGVTYRLGLGGYGPADTGTAVVSLTTQVPDAPTGLTATAGDTTAALTWTAAVEHGTPVLGQTVQCERDGGTWTTCASVALQAGGTRPTSTTVTGLVNGSSYRFRVLAGSVLGDGAPSAAAPSAGSAVPTGPSALTATAAPAVRGTGTTVQVGVTSHGTPVTGGTVTVSDGGAVLGAAPVAGGAAAIPVDPAVGTRTLTVAFSGTPGVTPGSTTVPVTSTAAPQVVDARWPARASAGSTSVLDTRSSAGLPVTLAVSGPCTLTGTRLTAVSPGRCTVTASAAGDADHLPAAPVTRAVDVLPPVSLDLRLDAGPGDRADGARVVGQVVGLEPGSTVVVELHSTPVRLSTSVVGPDGSLTVDTVLPTPVPPGRHEVVLLGTAPDGSEARTTLALSVSRGGRLLQVGADQRAGALAATGSPVLELTAAGLLALGSGAASTVVARRRSA